MTGPTWRCSACDTYNDAGLRACEICGTAKSVTMAAAKPAPKSASKPAGAKRTPPAKAKPKRKATPKSAAAGGSSATRRGPAKSTGRPGSPASRGAKSDDVGPDVAKRLADGSLDPELFFTGSGAHFRASPEMARLLPEIFNPDGSFRDKSLRDEVDVPRAWGRIGPTVADGGVIDLVTDPKPGPAVRPRPAFKPRSASGPKTRTAPETTRTDEVLGCGCLLVIAAAVITGIVMLVLHWNAVVHWNGIFSHSHASAKATPSPTVTASGPCPAPLTAMLPKSEAAGARLVAVYSRNDITEEYAFCKTTDNRYYFFGREGDKSKAFGSSGPATKITGGFDVKSTDNTTSVTTDFRFVDGKVASYQKGKKKWDAAIVPKASID